MNESAEGLKSEFKDEDSEGKQVQSEDEALKELFAVGYDLKKEKMKYELEISWM